MNKSHINVFAIEISTNEGIIHYGIPIPVELVTTHTIEIKTNKLILMSKGGKIFIPINILLEKTQINEDSVFCIQSEIPQKNIEDIFYQNTNDFHYHHLIIFDKSNRETDYKKDIRDWQQKLNKRGGIFFEITNVKSR